MRMKAKLPNNDSSTSDPASLLAHKVQSALDDNIEIVLKILEKNSDLIRRDFMIEEGDGPAGVLFYIDGLSSNQLIDSGVLRPFIIDSAKHSIHHPQVAEDIRSKLLVNPEIKIVNTIGEGIDGLLSGESLAFVNGCEQAFLAGTKGWESRSPSDPATEVVIRGPRDGFTENVRTNTSLIRRRIKDPMFRLESMKLGERSKTVVNIAYIDGVVKTGLVEEVKKRLQGIEIDGVLESGYIQEMIQDSPMSPFLTMKHTERPDTAAAAILEGRVVILTDSTPFALIAPTFFWEAFMAADDYYANFYASSFARVIRYIAFVISLVLPSIYVMLVAHHQEMLPTQLALSVAAGRESVPFPVLVEVLIMETAFELMREAGLRMPRPVGQAVSIVGSLIIGQAAVQAGIVSPIMVIVVALTGISSFAIPSYETSFTIRLLRFPVLLASAWFGLLGFIGIFMLISVHVLSLRSFGEPYLAPIIPFRPSDQKDSVIRLPWWQMKKRPWMATDEQREGNIPKPGSDMSISSQGKDARYKGQAKGQSSPDANQPAEISQAEEVLNERTTPDDSEFEGVRRPRKTRIPRRLYRED